MLRIDNVETGYGGVKVLRGATLEVSEGECVGLFGPNGHGKTTLLRAASNLLPAWSGSVSYRDQPTRGLTPGQLLKRGLVHVPQANTLFRDMTVEENLGLGAYSIGWRERRHRMERVFRLFPKLKDRRAQGARTLSGGERQMVSIGIGLMADPVLLMLDEPTLGLAPRVKEELATAIGKIASSGVSLLVVDQDIEFLMALTRKLYLLESGRIAFETGPDSDFDDDEVLKLYFGGAV
jgi:branched-chain amino acid transport system ATP-binding protein